MNRSRDHSRHLLGHTSMYSSDATFRKFRQQLATWFPERSAYHSAACNYAGHHFECSLCCLSFAAVRNRLARGLGALQDFHSRFHAVRHVFGGRKGCLHKRLLQQRQGKFALCSLLRLQIHRQGLIAKSRPVGGRCDVEPSGAIKQIVEQTCPRCINTVSLKHAAILKHN